MGLNNPVSGSPGQTIGPTPADTAVGVGATVALPAIPPGTRRVTVQNTTPAGASRIRVREVGAGAGRGYILVSFASYTFGGADGALAPLEVQHIAGPAATVSVIFERN